MDHKKWVFSQNFLAPNLQKKWVIGHREGENLDNTLQVSIQRGIYEPVKFPEARADRFH